MKSSTKGLDSSKVLIEPLNDLGLKEKYPEEDLNIPVSTLDSVDVKLAKYTVSIPPVVNPWLARADNLKSINNDMNSAQNDIKSSNDATNNNRQASFPSSEEIQSNSVKIPTNLSKKSKRAKQTNKTILGDGKNWPTLSEAMSVPKTNSGVNFVKAAKSQPQVPSKVGVNTIPTANNLTGDQKNLDQIKYYSTNNQRQSDIPNSSNKPHNRPNYNKRLNKRTQKLNNLVGTNFVENSSANFPGASSNPSLRLRPVNNPSRAIGDSSSQKSMHLRRQSHPNRPNDGDALTPILYPLAPFTYVDNSNILEDLVCQQIEYYFSIENLCRDVYFRRQMDQEGFVDIGILASFPRIRSMTSDVELIRKSLLKSNLLELNNFRVRRKTDWQAFLLPFQSQQFEVPVMVTPLHTIVSPVHFNPSFTPVNDSDLNNYYMMTSTQVNHSSSSSSSEIDHVVHYDTHIPNESIAIQPSEIPSNFYSPPEDAIGLSSSNKLQCSR